MWKVPFKTFSKYTYSAKTCTFQTLNSIIYMIDEHLVITFVTLSSTFPFDVLGNSSKDIGLNLNVQEIPFRWIWLKICILLMYFEVLDNG